MYQRLYELTIKKMVIFNKKFKFAQKCWQIWTFSSHLRVKSHLTHVFFQLSCNLSISFLSFHHLFFILRASFHFLRVSRKTGKKRWLTQARNLIPTLVKSRCVCRREPSEKKKIYIYIIWEKKEKHLPPLSKSTFS